MEAVRAILVVEPLKPQAAFPAIVDGLIEVLIDAVPACLPAAGSPVLLEAIPMVENIFHAKGCRLICWRWILVLEWTSAGQIRFL